MLRFLSEENGAASAEYALILVMICLGLGVAVWGMAGAVASRLSWAGSQIAQAAGVATNPNPAVATPDTAAARKDDPGAKGAQ